MTYPSLQFYQTGRCSPQLELRVICGQNMVFHKHGEGFQRVSLSPSDSGHDPGDMEPCAETLPMEIDEMSPGNVPCGGCFPADTPITPPAIGLTHKQFCDKIKGVPLPGDGPGRECFDTFPTFVVRDPSARFGSHAPLTYETTGEVGQPIWKDIFRHILKECSYLTAFSTVYMSWLTHVTSWHMGLHRMDYRTGLQLLRGGTVESNSLDRIRKKLNSCSFQLLKKLACIVCILPGLVLLYLLRWCQSFLASTSFCWTVIACRSHSSKLPTYGRKHTSQDSHLGLEKVCPCSTRCTGNVNLLTTRMWSLHSIGSMPTGRDKVSFLSLSHTQRAVATPWTCWCLVGRIPSKKPKNCGVG